MAGNDSLANWSRILDEMSQKTQDRTEKSRAALAKLEETVKLDTYAEFVIEIASRHRVAMNRLTGLTVPPANDEELAAWLEELERCAKFLNSLRGDEIPEEPESRS